MDIGKAQAVVDEIEAVCKKHGVALLGGDAVEGTYGEIQIVDVGDLHPDEINHIENGDMPYTINHKLFVVNGIK